VTDFQAPPRLSVNPEQLAQLSPEAQAEIAAALVKLEAAYKENPLLGYQPHGKQVEFHRPPFPPLRAFFGGNRSGKTTATMVDTIIQAVDVDAVPDHLRAAVRWPDRFYCRVVTPDLTGTMSGVVHQKFREWCPPAQFKGGSFDRAYSKIDRVLHFKNGNWIQFLSNDQDLDKFGGAALHRIVYDEEPRSDIRSECLTRLIDYDGEELFGMTPLNGLSWTYDDVYEPWEKLQAQDLSDEEIEAKLEARVVVVDMDDNPHLSETGKKRALASYKGNEREARKSGRFISFAGLVYPQFRSSEHVRPEEPVPAGAEVFCGIDPGLRFPAVVFCWLTPQDEMVVFDELLLPEHTIRQVCQAIRSKCAEWGIKPAWYVIDPAARNKNAQTGRSDQSEFIDNGIFPIPGQNSVEAGINRVRERLEANRLLLSASCTHLRDEFKRYRYVKAQTRTESEPKQQPVKRDDHLLDALRYVVMNRPLVPKEALPDESLSTKQRLLRAHLGRLKRKPVQDSGSGPGIFK
jgi:phage terminase large subunit-like protein